jgi:hypothetical protein
MLAEVSVPGKPGPGKIVAFSVWDVSFANKAKKGPGYEPQKPQVLLFWPWLVC